MIKCIPQATLSPYSHLLQNFVFLSSEFNNSFLDALGSDEDSGNEDIFDMEYTEAEAEELKRNAEVMFYP